MAIVGRTDCNREKLDNSKVAILVIKVRCKNLDVGNKKTTKEYSTNLKSILKESIQCSACLLRPEPVE